MPARQNTSPMQPEKILKELGYNLPESPTALASYVPAKRYDNLVVTSGQLPLKSGQIACPGKVGSEVTLDQAQEEARTAVINALAAVKSFAGLDEIREVIRLGVYVASADNFFEHHLVANGASDLLQKIFRDAGKHTRFAVGVRSLPLNACVEVELTVRL